MADETLMGAGPGSFPTTRWTRIVEAQGDVERRAEVLHELLIICWRPLYVLGRRRGLAVEDAKDAVQGFCSHLLQRDVLARLDPGRGRLRSYLCTAFDRFLGDERDRARAQKRGGGRPLLSLDGAALDTGPVDEAHPAEAAFDREWALGVFERTLAALQEEYDSGQRRGPFELVQTFFRAAEPPSYAEAAALHDMSVPALKAFLHRARRRFGELLREAVAETVSDAAEVEAEIAGLLEALGR